MVRALHPLMRLSRDLVNWYPAAMADAAWGGHYEFTLPTSALAAGARIEDLGGDGPFTPPERRGHDLRRQDSGGHARRHDLRLPPGAPALLPRGARAVRPARAALPPGEAGRPGLDQGVEEPSGDARQA